MIAPSCLALGIVLSLVAATAAGPGRAGGPTVAVEDTMRTELPEIMIRAPRVTLSEILDRVARGEAHRDSLIQDQTFRATFRLLSNTADPKRKPEVEFENVMRVYKKRPNLVRSIELRHWDRKPPKKGEDDDIDMSFRSDMSEEIVNFAFRPEARRDYKYRIVGRDLVGDHVIYRIHFEPKSPLDPTNPSGTVWVDTNDFVILRQEVDFTRSPLPLLLKGIDRMVIERQRVGRFWVLHRVLLRARFTLPMPRLGRRMDFSMQFDQWAVNTGLPDSLFVGGERE